jgi:hypothetical protein
MGYFNVFLSKKDYKSAKAIIQWALGILPGLKDANRNSILDKMGSVFYALLAMTQINTGDTEQARDSLCRAKDMAENFDNAPDYDADSVRFVTMGKRATSHDDIGTTAMEGIQKTIDSVENETLSKMWKEINAGEKE